MLLLSILFPISLCSTNHLFIILLMTLIIYPLDINHKILHLKVKYYWGIKTQVYLDNILLGSHIKIYKSFRLSQFIILIISSIMLWQIQVYKIHLLQFVKLMPTVVLLDSKLTVALRLWYKTQVVQQKLIFSGVWTKELLEPISISSFHHLTLKYHAKTQIIIWLQFW
jgi:hypothetical protein